VSRHYLQDTPGELPTANPKPLPRRKRSGGGGAGREGGDTQVLAASATNLMVVVEVSQHEIHIAIPDINRHWGCLVVLQMRLRPQGILETHHARPLNVTEDAQPDAPGRLLGVGIA